MTSFFSVTSTMYFSTIMMMLTTNTSKRRMSTSRARATVGQALTSSPP